MKKSRQLLAAAVIVMGLTTAAAGWIESSLAGLTARWDCTWDLVRVSWETADETDTIGFHVWRSDRRDGTYFRLTDQLYPASAGGFRQAVYVFEDENVYRHNSYYYSIEERRYGGHEIFYGPVRARDYCRDDDDDHSLMATCFIGALW